MAQIADVIRTSAVFDAARQELAWAYSGNLTGVPEKLKGAVDMISGVLNEAEMRWVMTSTEVMADGDEEGTAETREWLMSLVDVAYKMRDVARKKLLEDYMIDDKKLSARWLPCLPVTTSRNTSSRITPTIDDVAKNLDELMQGIGSTYTTVLLPVATCKEQPRVGGQEESTVTDVLVTRYDNAKQEIIEALHKEVRVLSRRHNNKGYYIFSITGPPCVGKTTMVKSVFDDNDALDYIMKSVYDDGADNDGGGDDDDALGSPTYVYVKVWVDMGKGWDIENIRTSIAEKLENGVVYGPGHGRGRSSGMYSAVVVLLVLDNMVMGLDYFREEMDKLHKKDHRRVIVIVTTASEALAKHISLTGPSSTYRLCPWSDDMCWEIINQTSGPKARTASDQEGAAAATASSEIAKKCSGIPLAAKALGRFLQNPQEWTGIRDNNPDIWHIRGGFSNDSKSQLPPHSITIFTHLKRSSFLGVESWLSFPYCAFAFPKDKEHNSILTRRDLLAQWCSLGITIRESGMSCISELLDRSLLLRKVSADEASIYQSESDEVAISSIMHDFARYLLGDRLIIVADGGNEATPPCPSVNKKSSSALVRDAKQLDISSIQPTENSSVNKKSSSSRAYLALVRDAKQLDISSILPPENGILALRFEDCKQIELSDDAFASAKHLRLLDLSGCSLKKLPDSIHLLKQLRYLKASAIQDEVFLEPVTGLHELIYLNLDGSRLLSDLTDAFWRLRNLLHLYLSGCSGLKELPKSFGWLWRLEHLDLSRSGIETLPESFVCLRSLTHLDLGGCSGLQALPEFERLRRLQHLNLSGCCSSLRNLPTSIRKLRELRHLDLSGFSELQELSADVLPMAMGLRHLNLSGCSRLEALHQTFFYLHGLVHLDLSGCSRLEALPEPFKHRELVHLDLSGCSELKQLPKDLQSSCEILQHLDLSGCSKLQVFPKFYYPGRLRYLDMSGCFCLRSEDYPNSELRKTVESVRSRGGEASGPYDASLKPRAASP